MLGGKPGSANIGIIRLREQMSTASSLGVRRERMRAERLGERRIYFLPPRAGQGVARET